MGRLRNLGENTLWVFLGNTGSKFITFFMMPFYTYWMSVEEYGVSDIIQVYLLFFSSFATLNIFEAIFVFPKKCNEREKVEFYSSGFLFCLLSLAVTFVFLLILANVFSNSILCEYYFELYLLIVSASLLAYGQQFTRCQNKLKYYGISGVIVTLLTALLSLLFIPNMKVKGYIISIFISNIIGFIYIFFIAKQFKYLNIRRFNKKKLMVMLKYSIPMIPNSIIWWILQSMNRPFLEYYQGLEAVGLFAVANKIPVFVIFLSSVFNNAWNISVIDEFGKKGFLDYYNSVIRIEIIFLSLVVMLIILIGPIMLQYLSDSKFYGCLYLLPILIASSFIFSLSGAVSSIFIAAKKSVYFLYSSLLGGILCLILYIFFTPSFGLIGVTVSIFISQVVICFSRLYYVIKIVSINYRCIFFYIIIISFVAFIFTLTNYNISGYIIAIILMFGLIYIERKILLNICYKIYENIK